MPSCRRRGAISRSTRCRVDGPHGPGRRRASASDKAPVVVADTPDADIRSFEWVNDERLVYDIVDLQVAGYDQMFGAGLFSVKRDGSERGMLIRAGRG